MKSKLSSLGWVLLLIPFISVGIVQAATAHTAKLDIEKRDVSAFTALAVAGSYEVEVKIGSTPSLSLEGDKSDLEKTETFVKDGTLHVRQKKISGITGNRIGKVKVFITATSLKALSQAGSGTISVLNRISGDNLAVSLSGSGQIKIDTSLENMSASISGSGAINVGGSVENTSISLSGSGKLNGSELKATNVSAKISGSGSVRIQAEKSLAANIAGSGNVYYTGDPDTKIKTSGSGRARKV